MPAHADALLAAVEEGVAFDGLDVSVDGSYTFETPERTHAGLDRTALHEIAADSPFVRNWYFWHELAPQHAPRWAFLRWLEGLDTAGSESGLDVPAQYEHLDAGQHRTWAQLRLTVGVDSDGRRRYQVRHIDDAAASDEELEQYTDPTAVREIIRYDDCGRYRPLKTAPTLPSGWDASGLDSETFVEFVRTVYPASVENWYLEREGRLDVTHWRETMTRQTGMYGVVETWDRGDGHEHVERVAESCCVDSECLKRRVWEYDDETPLETPGGEGVFPCREPCSLVISAARQWARLAGEQPQTYDIELTPSEKAQLERIVEAVADGESAAIREAAFEDGANRWRARFLRETVFDSDGTLPTQTEQSDK